MVILATCKCGLYAICRVKDCLPRNVLVKVIESTILSKLYYAPSVIQGAPPSYVEQTLTRVVNFGAKMVYGLRKFDHVTEVRQRLKWCHPKSELRKKTQLMAYKLFLDPTIIALSQTIELSNTRTSNRLSNVPKFKILSYKTDSNAARRAFSYRAPVLLNDICGIFKIDCNSPISYDKFKCLLKYYYKVNL